MAVTPFLKLQKPPFDTIPWDEAVNGNMDTIDAFISRYMAVPNYVGAWANSTNYVSGQNVLDISNATIYLCQVTHVSSATPATFAQDRATYPTYWAATTNVVSGSIALTIAEVTPLSSKAGDLWWNSAEGQLYILYNDGNSLQWVVANNQSGNIGDAPRDGNVYGRQMGAWVGSVNSQDVGRNKLHNGLFTVAQRGAGPFTVNGYTADRWGMVYANGSQSVSVGALVDATRASIGDEAAVSGIQAVVTGSATAGSYNAFYQILEGVRRLSGKTVILSFWAWSAAGNPKLGAMMYQGFGTGGSPSAAVLVPGQSVTVSTTPTRYAFVFAVPSTAGKTFGTNNNDGTGLQLYFSAAADNNTNSGSVGVQSGTFYLWGVQLEIAAPGQTQPSPLEKKDPRMELSDCQRFYQVGQMVQSAYNGAGAVVYCSTNLPVTMRVTPTMVITPTVTGNATAIICNSYNATSIFFQATVTAANSNTTFGCTYIASADL